MVEGVNVTNKIIVIFLTDISSYNCVEWTINFEEFSWVALEIEIKLTWVLDYTNVSDMQWLTDEGGDRWCNWKI